MFAAGHEPTKKYATAVLGMASELAGTKVGVAALHSTLGRVAARSIRCAVLNDTLHEQFAALVANIAKGDTVTCNPPTSRRASSAASASTRRRAASSRTGS